MNLTWAKKHNKFFHVTTTFESKLIEYENLNTKEKKMQREFEHIAKIIDSVEEITAKNNEKQDGRAIQSLLKHLDDFSQFKEINTNNKSKVHEEGQQVKDFAKIKQQVAVFETHLKEFSEKMSSIPSAPSSTLSKITVKEGTGAEKIQTTRTTDETQTNQTQPFPPPPLAAIRQFASFHHSSKPQTTPPPSSPARPGSTPSMTVTREPG